LKFQGAEIGNFGTFSWESKIVEGESLSRPIFLIAPSFIKDHKIKKQRIHNLPLIATAEPINFSQLAIKFSKILTKDTAFSCIRDIIKKIGEFVDRNLSFDIEFSFGHFYCRERVVKFEFDYAKFSKVC